MAWALGLLAAFVSALAEHLCRRFHAPTVVATTIAALAFGVAGALAARRSGVRLAGFAVLVGAAVFAAAGYVILVRAGVRPAAALVGALLDFGFAAAAGALGVARTSRRSGGRDAKR
jgi:hypothetical protein